MSRKPIHDRFDAVVEVHPRDAVPQVSWGTVKITYRARGEALEPIGPEPLRHDIRNGELKPRWPSGSDFWPFKLASDVAILGSAFAPGGRPVPERSVSVRVGNARKRIRVSGKRVLDWTLDHLRFPGAEPFTEMPLTNANAYGGIDYRVPVEKVLTFPEIVGLLADLPGAYPRNPLGKGYLVRDEPREGVELPNLEDPDKPLTPERLLARDPRHWHRQPVPWTFDWRPFAMFPRFRAVGAEPWFPVPPDVTLEEAAAGWIPATWRSETGDIASGRPIPDWYFQEASLGMTFSDLREGTPFELLGMHPERERWSFVLPASPRLAIEVEGDRQPVEARILHVVVIPHEEKVEITWAGVRRDMPRAFFPGIHGDIPITLWVDETPVRYETPEPIYPQIKRAEAEGRLLGPPPRRLPGESLEIVDQLAPNDPADRSRDQIALEDTARIGDVDPVAGRLLLEATDWTLSAPSFAFRRFYSSSMAWRSSSLGGGWHHSLEQAVWHQDGWLLYRAEDGREIPISLPGGHFRIGARGLHSLDGVSIQVMSSDTFDVRLRDGRRLVFNGVAQSVQAGPPMARLSSMFTVDGQRLDLGYDVHGRLEKLVLPSGSYVRFEHDAHGRLTRVFVPTRDGRDWAVGARYEHDRTGQLREAVDGSERATRYRYQGRLLTKVSSDGLVRSFAYDGIGSRARCVSETWDDDRKKREYGFGIQDRVSGIADARGWSFSMRSTPSGAVDRVLDRFAHETRQAFDETSGSLVSQTTPDGESSYLYDAEQQLADVSRPDAASIALEHDGEGRLVRLTDADGQTARWRWDAEGRLSSASDSSGASTIYDYDAQGPLTALLVPGEVRLELTIDPSIRALVAVSSGASRRVAQRDALLRVMEIADELGETTKYAYDPSGRVCREQLPTAIVWAFESDRDARVTRLDDGASSKSFERDSHGRLVFVDEGGGVGPRLHRDAEGRVTMVENEQMDFWELTRDASGRVQEELGVNGEKVFVLRDHRRLPTAETRAPSRTEVTRDRAGRPVDLEHADKTFQKFVWTPGGKLRRADDGDRMVELSYDGEGRPLVEKQNEHWVQSRYDARGARVEVASSLGLRVKIDRDAHGSAVRVRAQLGEKTSLELRLDRDACGRETCRHLPGGIEVRFERDAIGRQLERSVVFGTSTLAALRFGWAGLDRLVRVEDPARGARMHVHDARGRLVRAGACIRAMDDIGNVYRDEARRDQRFAKGGRLEEAFGTVYRYDAGGRRTEKETPDGSRVRYKWDPRGRLIEVSTSDTTRITYDYDALGRCARRRVESKLELDGVSDDDAVWEANHETRYIWDGLTLLHELEGQHVTTWLWEAGVLVGKLTLDGAYAVLTDPLGVPTEVLDERGGVAWRGVIDAFGLAALEAKETACPWRFPGHYEDPDTGLHHTLFRVYDPETGSYLTQSPLGIAGGSNLYAYVSDPMSQASPLGLGHGYTTFFGEFPSERLAAELIDMIVRALDRGDGAAGPRGIFDRKAARLRLPDPEATLWGSWERYRPSRQLPPPTSMFTRLPAYLGLYPEDEE